MTATPGAREHALMAEVVITVTGTPVPQGSKRGFVVGNRAVIVDDNKPVLRTWRGDVKKAAEETGSSMLLQPVGVEIQFSLARPRSHYRTGKSTGHLLTGTAPAHPKGKPDVDKLARAVLDGLKAAGMYADDAQVIDLHAIKSYARRGQAPGAVITIREIWEQEP
jgi:Holliday junction resolvase RusA-like endonuclease